MPPAGYRERVIVNIRGENLETGVGRVLPQQLQKDHTYRVSLFTGSAADDPDPQLIALPFAGHQFSPGAL